MPAQSSEKTILFVIGQAGQASFCMPLWDKWLDSPPDNINWHIWASADALKKMERVQHLPLLDNWEEANTLFDIRPEDTSYDLIISSASLHPQEIIASNDAANHNIKHVQFLDTWYDYVRRIKHSNPEGRMPDEIWMMDERAAQEAVTAGLPANKLRSIGHPTWENALSEPKNTAPHDIVVFAGQPLSQIPSLASLGYNEKDVWALLVDFQKNNPDLISELIYAPHPAEKNIPNVFPKGTRLIAENENPLIIAGTMVSMFTALMIEGYLRGQNIVSLQPNLQEKNKCALSHQGLIPLVTSTKDEDLAKALENGNTANNDLRNELADSLNRLEEAIQDAIP